MLVLGRLPALAHVLTVACVLALATPGVEAAPAPLPTPLGYVSDFAGVIDGATKARLTNLIRELKQKTGAEIAVVTSHDRARDPVRRAIRLAEAWKPGDRRQGQRRRLPGRGRGPRDLHPTGYGIEGALPDGQVGEIRDRMIVPKFRAGDYSRAASRPATIAWPRSSRAITASS